MMKRAAAEVAKSSFVKTTADRPWQGGPGKGTPVRRLPAETTRSWKWIAAEWHWGRWTHVSKFLGRKKPKVKIVRTLAWQPRTNQTMAPFSAADGQWFV